jgi:leucyl aminopeptidase
MNWGKSTDPKITLVGKGVCFDTGGLNIKPGSAMSLMKKDMGGAANVLALALMIMDANLSVNLRVLIPAVENSISANAFRPSDILISRKGLSIQIDNTDAEGRLVLADALALASEDKPELMIDMATLTGAARVALGPDLPPYYTDDETLASEIYDAGQQEEDHVWRMPLYKGYEADVTPKITDLTNAPSGGFAGSITAALFLKRFVDPEISWVHFDIYGWNPKDRAHAPVGGEAQAIRSLYRVLKDRYPAT